ncbi:MAG TPA: hypothetical protein VKD72_39395 [Gemmataceae bacterium]|nr:hypothetical protein [Gemmataceae bacterium]
MLAARAVFLADSGKPERAAADFDVALNLIGEKSPQWRCGQAVMQQAVQRNDVFEHLVKLRPLDTELVFHRCVFHVWDGQMAEAQAQALRLAPHADPLQRTALALLVGDRENFERLRGAARENPNLYMKTHLLAMAPTEEPMTTDLLATAEQMWQQGGNSWMHRRALGMAQLRAGRLDDAVSSLEASPTKATWQEDAYLWALLAMAHYQLDHGEEARKWLHRCELWFDWTGRIGDTARLFGSYDGLGVTYLLACIYYLEAKALIEGPAAATNVREFQAQRAQAAESRREAAAAAAEANAEAALQRAVELAGSNPVPWIERGRWYAKRGRLQKADTDFACAFQLAPAHPLCRLERARRERTVIAAWDFSKGLEGVSEVALCKLSTAGGVLTIDSTGTDPSFVSPEFKATAGRKELTICARIHGTQQWQLFWSATQSGWSEDKSVAFVIEGGDGEWHEYRAAFDPSPDLTGLRFDPPDETGIHAELAWIMLAEHPHD